MTAKFTGRDALSLSIAVVAIGGLGFTSGYMFGQRGNVQARTAAPAVATPMSEREFELQKSERIWRLEDCIFSKDLVGFGWRNIDIDHPFFAQAERGMWFSLQANKEPQDSGVVMIDSPQPDAPNALLDQDGLKQKKLQPYDANSRAFYAAIQQVCTPYVFGGERAVAVARMRSVQFDAPRLLKKLEGLKAG